MSDKTRATSSTMVLNTNTSISNSTVSSTTQSLRISYFKPSQSFEALILTLGGMILTGCIAYSLSTTLASRQKSTISVETVAGYALVLIGYLLLPGVGVLLVRRKRCLARTAALLEQTSDVNDQLLSQELCSLPVIGGEDSSIRKDVDTCTQCYIREKTNSCDDVQCVVCLAEVEDGEESRELECGHLFHKECADLWLISGRNNRCPLCMTTVCKGRDEHMQVLR